MTRSWRMTAFALALAGVGAGAAGVAIADPGGRAGGRIDFTALDADGDGTVTRAELTARATEQVGAADANGDGALDRAEIVAAMPDRRGPFGNPFGPSRAEAHADRMLALFGATEAGQVEIAEIVDRRINRLFAAADENRDDALSQAEADAISERAENRGGRHGDRDGDRPRGRF